MQCNKRKPLYVIAFLAILALAIAACSGGSGESSPTSSPTAIIETSTPTPGPTIAPAQPTATVQPATSTPIPTATVESGDVSDTVAKDGDAVAVHYTGTLDNGEVFDTSRDGDPPLEFMLGAGQMIPGFEKAVRGMAVGEVKTTRFPPDEAYGEHDEGLIFELPRQGAPEGLKVGDVVRMSNGMPVTILEMTDETVVIDANHRLAGEALTFEIEVMSIN